MMVGVQSSLQKPYLVMTPILSTPVAQNAPSLKGTHEILISPDIFMNGKMQGLPVSGPLTVWQLELVWSKTWAASLLTRDPDSRDGAMLMEAADVPW